LVGHPPKKEIGLVDVGLRVTMQLFIRDPYTVIAASV
jgi:hypothetical protein